MYFLLRTDHKMAVYSNHSTGIQKHLQSIFNLLRPQDTLKMAVRLESLHPGRVRYLVVVTYTRDAGTACEESCLLGVDCRDETTIGMVLPVWADTKISLDGDGGFSVSASCKQHIFKPISVQAMWSSLQTLHKASDEARRGNLFQGGSAYCWTQSYMDRISSDRSCLNEWLAMDGLTSKRPPSPDLCREPAEERQIKDLIRCKLREIMTTVDLDEVTSKLIRTRLESEMDRNLIEYKSYIDEEMLKILGQMDTATQIFEYLYLGSEWNASNLEELKHKGVEKILNVTREIDNFYPGAFDYYNVRVCDDDSTEMLKHWDKTYRYIWKAMEEGSKVLVHCKMGISRSASVVIAYVMKAKNWNLHKAMNYVKNKRTCIKPNENFLKQLEVYQGILSASKQRHNSLWRSKSETNFNSCSSSTSDSPTQRLRLGDEAESPHFRSTVSLTEQTEQQQQQQQQCSKSTRRELVQLTRPKSWSPDLSGRLFGEDPVTPPQTPKRKSSRQRFGTDPSCYLIYQAREKAEETSEACENQEPENRASPQPRLPRVNSVKERISELEGQPKRKRSSTQAVKINSRAGLVLNLANQFEAFESATFYSNRSSPSTRNPHDKHTSRSFNLHDMTKPTVARGRPPIPSPKRGNSRTHGTSVNLISRRGSKAAQVTPEREEGMQRRSAALNQSIIMTDLSVVPQGTVSKTKAKIENLKRTHSFENPLTRQTSRSILKIGLSIESLN